MVIIKCTGGLGNQIFLYALYKNFEKRNMEVYFDIEDFKDYKLHNGYELEYIFDLNINYADKDKISKIKINKNQYIKKLLRKFSPKLVSHKILEPYSYNNEIFHMKNVYLEGYGQNIEYIKFVEEELRNDLKFNLNDNINRSVIENMEKDENAVAIHIRRGDYVDNPEAYKIYGGICEIEYYNKAINLIKENVKNPTFYIFSNDFEWVNENLKMKNTHYIDYNKGKDSYKDLILMSHCKHNIIANSTFSWWGAWLNSNKEKIVIMPKKWTNTQENTLFYNGCILI